MKFLVVFGMLFTFAFGWERHKFCSGEENVIEKASIGEPSNQPHANEELQRSCLGMCNANHATCCSIKGWHVQGPETPLQLVCSSHVHSESYRTEGHSSEYEWAVDIQEGEREGQRQFTNDPRGCAGIQDRNECCNFKDGRDAGWARMFGIYGAPCMPSKPNLRYFGGNVCEFHRPGFWSPFGDVMGTCPSTESALAGEVRGESGDESLDFEESLGIFTETKSNISMVYASGFGILAIGFGFAIVSYCQMKKAKRMDYFVEFEDETEI